MIKNIIFDLGGVLLNIDFALTQKAFSELGMENALVKFSQHMQLGFFDQLDRGEISDEEFISKVKSEMPSGTSDEDIRQAWNAMLLDFPQQNYNLMLTVNKNYRTFLMSNTNSIHFPEYQKNLRETFGISSLDDLFEKSYYSFISGKRKPEADFFELILNENGLIASETVFIDDTLPNTRASASVGIKGLYLPPELKLTDLFTKDGYLKENNQYEQA
ncbi:MAG: HAD family phosphatase [Marinilabiliales bacterium]|nr:MAG: HAD family phosphatase [Marinilabiliales bacterium]